MKLVLTYTNHTLMRMCVDAARSCFKPADGRVMQNCLRFMRGCRVLRLAFATSQKTKKMRERKMCAKM